MNPRSLFLLSLGSAQHLLHRSLRHEVGIVPVRGYEGGRFRRPISPLIPTSRDSDDAAHLSNPRSQGFHLIEPATPSLHCRLAHDNRFLETASPRPDFGGIGHCTAFELALVNKPIQKDSQPLLDLAHPILMWIDSQDLCPFALPSLTPRVIGKARDLSQLRDARMIEASCALQASNSVCC